MILITIKYNNYIMSIKILEGKCTEELKDPIIKYPFALYDFQKSAHSAINKDENLLVLVPTASGKTIVAEMALIRAIKNGKKAIFLSPIKSLSNEKYRDFKNKFTNEKFIKETNIEVSVGLLTGDNKINPEANLLILTAEIFRNALYKLKKTEAYQSNTIIASDIISNIGVVVFDEFHFINDISRGSVWEEILVLLDKSVQLIMLSATFSNPETFAQWLVNIKSKNVNIIRGFKRIIPLKHYIYTDETLHMVMDENNKYVSQNLQKARLTYNKQKLNKKHNFMNLITESIVFLHKNDMLPALYFAFSRNNCELYAKSIQQLCLVSQAEIKEIDKIFIQEMRNYEKQYENLVQYQTLKQLIYKGIAFHHSGLIPILKELVEIIFHKKLIKVLFCTESLAVGINLPTRTCVFTGLMKNTEQGKRNLLTSEYFQMSGRSGRTGLDTYGSSVILPLYEFPTDAVLQEIMCGKNPSIESKFTIDYSFILKIFQSETSSVLQFINSSLYYKEINNILCGLKQTQQDILTKYNNIIITASEDDIKLFKETIRESSEMDIGINIRISKTMKKKMDDTKQKINSDINLKTNYENYCLKSKLKEQLTDLDNQIYNIEKSLENNCNKIITFLDSIGYIIKNDKKIEDYNQKDITQKGIASSYVNECNPILLVEMLMNNLFDELLPEEIVGILAIFVDDNKSENGVTLEDVNTTDKIYNTIQKVKKIINNLEENEFDASITNNDYWNIDCSNVENAYYWACGSSIQELQEYGEIYEGNFVRNMLKIVNIVHTLQTICQICNKIELLPKLEKIDKLVIRDIVTINSLYLN